MGPLSISAAGFAGFGIAIAFYAATLLPGVAYWDTGEMQTVPYVLGIAHPTGFPLFVLGGWVFAHALPVGDPAWRLSLFSALASAGAAGCLAIFVAGVARAPFAGIAAAVVFALGDVAWTRATRAEVHDLALFCIAVALVAAEHASRCGSGRALALAGFAAGCGLAAHPVVLLALPGIVLVAWPAIRAVSPRTVLTSAALGACALLLYAYVPLRSAFVELHRLDPERALGITGGAIWDDDAPSNLASFLRYVAGTSFRPDRSAVDALGAAGLQRGYGLALATIYHEYGYLILALALTGFTYLAIVRPFAAAGLAAIAVLAVVFAANFGAESDVERYALAGLWSAAACAGIGAVWLARSIAGERRGAAAVLAGALLLGGLWPNAAAAAAHVARAERLADARPLLADVRAYTKPGSLLIASWTFATPLAYRAYVTRALDRRLLCGWPLEYAAHFAAWRRAYGHVYLVVPPRYVVAPYARRIEVTARYTIAEVRS